MTHAYTIPSAYTSLTRAAASLAGIEAISDGSADDPFGLIALPNLANDIRDILTNQPPVEWEVRVGRIESALVIAIEDLESSAYLDHHNATWILRDASLCLARVRDALLVLRLCSF